MTTFDDGTIHVFTYKDGLLSRLAHDLRLTLRSFEVTLDGDAVKGTFWPNSLQIDGAMKKGKLNTGELKDHHKTEIKGNITDKILQTGRHDEITFEGTRTSSGANTWTVSGTLSMVGKSAPIDIEVSESNGHFTGEVELVPTRWGIAPYKAIGGAIKLKDKLTVTFELIP